MNCCKWTYTEKGDNFKRNMFRLQFLYQETIFQDCHLDSVCVALFFVGQKPAKLHRVNARITFKGIISQIKSVTGDGLVTVSTFPN